MLALIGNGARAYTKALHPAQWRHLLEKAGTRLVFVRQDQRGSSQHWGHAILKGVKNAETLIIRPDTRHQKDEEVPLADTHLWKSKTVHNHMGGIPEPELNLILEEGARMATGSDDIQVNEAEIVLMDIGELRLYAGNPRPGKYLWTDKIAEAVKYKKIGHAHRSVSMLHRSLRGSGDQISEAGLAAVTVKQVWAIKQKAKELRLNDGELPRLRRLSEVPEPNPKAIPELYEVAFANGHPNGKATNPPPLSKDEKRQIAAQKKAAAEAAAAASNGNGHHAGVNGNGNGNGVAPRIAPFMGQQMGFQMPTDMPAAPQHPPVQIDPSVYNMASVPVAIAEADKEVAAAWQEVHDLQNMLTEAMAKARAAEQKRQMLSLQIQPQLMVQAVRAEAMALMKQGQQQLIQMLTDVAQGKVPTIDGSETAPDASGDTEGAEAADDTAVAV